MENTVHFYYLRNPQQQHQPIGCVAIHANADGTINRGVSVCSWNDNFSKKKARSLALTRLSLADKGLNIKFGKYYGRSNSVAGMPDCPFENAAANNVQPTESEYRILHKPGEPK